MLHVSLGPSEATKTRLIFCNNPKGKWKNPIGILGNQSDANLQGGPQNHVLLLSLYQTSPFVHTVDRSVTSNGSIFLRYYVKMEWDFIAF